MPIMHSVYKRAAATTAGAVVLIVASTFTATAAAAAPANPVAAPASTTTSATVGATLTASAPSSTVTYGLPWFPSATLTIDGPAMIMGSTVTFRVDGTDFGTGYLMWAGADRFTVLSLFTTEVPAGTYALTAHFAGATSTTPAATVGTATSSPVTLTVAPASTSTAITSAPTTATVVDPITVTAQVAGGTLPPVGDMSLMAAGREIARTPVGPTGVATFASVLVPAGTTDLTAVFNDAGTGNFARSASAPSALAITDVATQTAVSAARVAGTVDQPPVARIRVTATNGAGTDVAAAGRVQAYLAGSPVGDPVALVAGEADLSLSGLAVGEHAIEVRFLPDAGFVASVAAIAVEITQPTPAPAAPTDTAELPPTGFDPATATLAALLAIAAIGAGVVLMRRRRTDAVPQ